MDFMGATKVTKAIPPKRLSYKVIKQMAQVGFEPTTLGL